MRSATVRLLALLAAMTVAAAGPIDGQENLDARVKKFLDSKAGEWRDLNVPAVDGQTLHDLIVKHKFTRALEIGTSTGHSGIWIAWALSKTGGRLITIDIDERRHKEAVANFDAAGVAKYIDARLGDAHAIVPALEGPFDFVFSDADKEWYKNYAIAVLPKVVTGGCYTSHNVFPDGRRNSAGGKDYIDYLLAQPRLETTFDTRGNGLAISCRK